MSPYIVDKHGHNSLVRLRVRISALINSVFSNL